MPAAAVIPAPRVYTKAVAVKKLVVNFGNLSLATPSLAIKMKKTLFFVFIAEKRGKKKFFLG